MRKQGTDINRGLGGAAQAFNPTMMRFALSTRLLAAPERVWQELRKPVTLQKVAYPLLTFRMSDGQPLPDTFQAGGTYRLAMFSFGFLPLGRHSIHLVKLDPAARELYTHEHGDLIQNWNHRISVRETNHGQTHYTDALEIASGWKTVFLWLYAHAFFRYRQYRRRQLAKTLSQPHDD
ncbi:MAG: hypothetical protein H7Z75_01635 [Ferruginibacter sp.]|nr:hypothetical protein [Cytophagales bacterium]